MAINTTPTTSTKKKTNTKIEDQTTGIANPEEGISYEAPELQGTGSDFSDVVDDPITEAEKDIQKDIARLYSAGATQQEIDAIMQQQEPEQN